MPPAFPLRPRCDALRREYQVNLCPRYPSIGIPGVIMPAATFISDPDTGSLQGEQIENDTDAYSLLFKSTSLHFIPANAPQRAIEALLFIAGCTIDFTHFTNPSSCCFGMAMPIPSVQHHWFMRVRFWPFSADHGYEACWSSPMQSVVRTNENVWSSGVQFRNKLGIF